MGEVVEIIKTVHDILKVNEDVPITLDARGLGMAYAIPRGSETNVDTFGPWHSAEVKQVFYKQSSVVGSVLAEIQLIMSWRFSEAQQYIIDANLDKNVITIDPTVSVSISVRFNQPTMFDRDLEAYEIPFSVNVDYRPVGSNSISLFRGTIRASGQGSFNAV
jgi:hypothetical protein